MNIKIGDILVYPYGIHKTHWNFYKVTKVMSKTLTIQNLKKEIYNKRDAYFYCVKPTENEDKMSVPFNIKNNLTYTNKRQHISMKFKIYDDSRIYQEDMLHSNYLEEWEN